MQQEFHIPCSRLTHCLHFALHSNLVIHVNLFVSHVNSRLKQMVMKCAPKADELSLVKRYVWAVSSQKKTCLTSLGPKLALHLGHLRCWLFKISCTQGLQNKWKHFVMTTWRAKRKGKFNMKWIINEKKRKTDQRFVEQVRKRKYKIQS